MIVYDIPRLEGPCLCIGGPFNMQLADIPYHAGELRYNDFLPDPLYDGFSLPQYSKRYLRKWMVTVFGTCVSVLIHEGMSQPDVDRAVRCSRFAGSLCVYEVNDAG